MSATQGPMSRALGPCVRLWPDFGCVERHAFNPKITLALRGLAAVAPKKSWSNVNEGESQIERKFGKVMLISKWVSVAAATGALLVASSAFAQHRGGTRGSVVIRGGHVPVVVAPTFTYRPARPVVIARPAPVVIQAAPIVVRPIVRPIVIGAPAYYPEPPPPVYVAYRPAPPPEPMVEYRDRPAPYRAPYRSPNHMYNNQFGLNLNAQSGAVGTSHAPATGLLGIGAALRYRPIPWVGIEGGISVYTGRDFNYDTRNEVSGQGNIYGYINPQSPLQLYALAGVTYTSARIGDGYGQTLTTNRYVGAQAGLGLELRFNRHFALNGDLRAVVRTRTDDDLLFVQGSRTSGGIMGSVGMTVYF